ncbi:thioesterase domain-containing protein [Streptomyces niveus]|uniref:thioesterase domain-containing protein n=1 Tax=Streptomyces niveus TaxID=193462 RepID=UPI0036A5799E
MSTYGSSRSVESALCEIWSGLFGTEVRAHDDFFDIGGDSLKVVDVVIAARERGIALRSSAVFRNPTPARLAESLTLAPARIEALASTEPPAALTSAGDESPADGGADRYLVPILDGPSVEPLFLFHSDHLTGAEREAAVVWGGKRPVLGLLSPGARSTAPWTGTVTELADRYADELLGAWPDGPYFLAGIGTGAVLAYETARVLRGLSHEVALLMLVRPTAPAGTGPVALDEALRTQLAKVTARFGLGGDESGQEVLARLRAEGWYEDGTGAEELPRLQRASAALAVALGRYRPEPYDGQVVLLQDEREAAATEAAWGPLLADCRTHWFEYGVESLRPVLMDSQTVDVMRKELAL